MANRLLLTLLALLTGLAAPVSASQARASQVSAMQVVLTEAAAAARAPRAPVALARLPEPGLRNTRRQAPARIVVAMPAPTVGVHTGIDRAHE